MFQKGDFLFTSESTFRGHPDKVCDQIADAILDEFLANDPSARTALEVMIFPHKVVIAGETYAKFHLSNTQIDFITREVLRTIGYVDNQSFSWDNVNVSIQLASQSPEICAAGCFDTPKEKASDQGVIFGYAINHNRGFIPDTIFYAHQLVSNIEKFIKKEEVIGLGPDGKCQITMRFVEGRAVAIEKIVISIMHDNNFTPSSIKSLLLPIIDLTFAHKFKVDAKNILVNPSGSFKIGGPESDTGLTGRKQMVDAYGGFALQGGGSFSGKDPSKLDRTAAYALRHLAKNIVAAGLTNECLLQAAYAIGVQEPIAVTVFTGDEALDSKLQSWVLNNYNLSPYGIKHGLELARPIYYPTSYYGHFGRINYREGFFPWEKLNLIEKIRLKDDFL